MWLTTGDVARMLERTPRGTRWLADDQQMVCERTVNGQRLYRKTDVQRLVERRAEARLKGVKVLRPRRMGSRDGPRQLSLFGPRRVESLPEGEVQHAESGRDST